MFLLQFVPPIRYTPSFMQVANGYFRFWFRYFRS